jgi:hypothetical protein
MKNPPSCPARSIDPVKTSEYIPSFEALALFDARPGWDLLTTALNSDLQRDQSSDGIRRDSDSRRKALADPSRNGFSHIRELLLCSIASDVRP